MRRPSLSGTRPGGAHAGERGILSSSSGGVAFFVSSNYRFYDVDGSEYVHSCRCSATHWARYPWPPLPSLTGALSVPSPKDVVRDEPTNDANLAMAYHILHCPVRALATQLHDTVCSTLVQLL